MINAIATCDVCKFREETPIASARGVRIWLSDRGWRFIAKRDLCPGCSAQAEIINDRARRTK